METVHIAPLSAAPAKPGLTRFTLVRILLALLAVCLPVALVMIVSRQIPDKSLRAYWPPLLGALVGYGGYLLYVRKIERRVADELRGPGAGAELAKGLVLGTLLFLAALAVVALFGGFQLTGMGSVEAAAKACSEMIFVGLMEEVLFRGILFRITERSLGSWAALAISSVIFALAHVPNDGITAIGIGNTVLAGVMFGAAYLVTRRLWLAVGMHFAWNFVSDGVFSLPTSGHAARGLLQVQLSGADWLTGGAYGIEASVATFAVLIVVSGLLLRQAVRKGQIAGRNQM